MKVIRLTSRNIFGRNPYYFSHMVKFTNCRKAEPLERSLRKLYGSGYSDASGWRGYFGSTPRFGERPYFVAVKEESMLTMAVLGITNE